MNGLTAADGIIKAVAAETRKSPGRHVSEVRVKVGRFMFADIAELTSAWNLLVTDTPLRSAKFTVKTIDDRICVLDEVIFD